MFDPGGWGGGGGGKSLGGWQLAFGPPLPSTYPPSNSLSLYSHDIGLYRGTLEQEGGRVLLQTPKRQI